MTDARDDGRDHGNEQLPHPPRATSSRWSRACAASSRTGSCPGSSASRPASRRSATSSRGSPRAACRPSTTSGPAPRRGRAPVLEQEAAKLRPGESGLLALDWWNGNRSVLVDADLSGLLVGMTLATTASGDLPRADRGDGVRDARDHRRVRVGSGVPVDADRRLRRTAAAEQAADADLRRRHRARVQRRRVAAGARARLGDVRQRSRPAPRSAATTRSSTPPSRWRTSRRDRTGRRRPTTPRTS